jgi:hypothetical protein
MDLNQEIFKKKYLKYKEKYLELKSLGGAFDSVKADRKVTASLNKLNLAKDKVAEINKQLEAAIQKELQARDDYANDRDDKNKLMLLESSKKVTYSLKAQVEKAEIALASASEAHRKIRKSVSEEKLKYGEKIVNATKANLIKSKKNLETLNQSLKKAQINVTLTQQKIDETNQTISLIEKQLKMDEDNLKSISNEQLSSITGRSSDDNKSNQSSDDDDGNQEAL